MSIDRRSRGVRAVLVFVAVGLMACLVGSFSPAAAEDEPPPPTPTPEEMAEIQATVEATVNEAAAAPEQDAASAFLAALFVKFAELRARYGSVVGPGQRIPQSALDGISWELHQWMKPYARELCLGNLKLDGISDRIAEGLRVRTWMYFVPPILFLFLGIRRGVCEQRVLDSAPAYLPPPCQLANGHDEADWFWETSNGYSGGPFPNGQWAAWTEMFATVPNLSLVWDARDLPGSMGQVYGHTFHGDFYCVHD